jgi:hypothetical protein
MPYVKLLVQKFLWMVCIFSDAIRMNWNWRMDWTGLVSILIAKGPEDVRMNTD